MTGNEDDLTGRAKEYGSPQIAFGTVGWEGAPSHIDKGNLNGQPGERHTLVRVTLTGSHSVRGQQVLCSLNSLAGHRIPRLGARVLVAIPFEMSEAAGVGVIIAATEDDPERLEEDRRVLDYSGEHVIIRGKSVAIESEQNEFVAVGEPRTGGTSGVTIQAQDGSGAVWQVGVASLFVAQDGDAKSVLQMTPSAIECMCKAGSMWKLDAGFYTLGETCTVAGGAVYLGRVPTPTTPAVYGPLGITGVGSTSVFVSP